MLHATGGFGVSSACSLLSRYVLMRCSCMLMLNTCCCWVPLRADRVAACANCWWACTKETIVLHCVGPGVLKSSLSRLKEVLGVLSLQLCIVAM